MHNQPFPVHPKWMEVKSMSGRNNKPDNDGPAASPSRLDQFGDKLADDTKASPKQVRNNEKPAN